LVLKYKFEFKLRVSFLEKYLPQVNAHSFVFADQIEEVFVGGFVRT